MRWVVFAVAVLATGCSFDSAGTTGNAADDPPDASGVDAVVPVDYLFADGFENGILPAWTGENNEAGDVNDLTPTPARTGSFSLRSTTDTTGNAQASTYIDFAPQSELYTRQYFYLPGNFASTDYVALLSYVNHEVDWINLFHVLLDASGEIYTHNQADQTYQFSGVIPALNQWHSIDTHVVFGTSGTIEVAIDGVQFAAETGVDTGTLDVSRVVVGIVWQGNTTESLRLFTDDVIVHDGPI